MGNVGWWIGDWGVVDGGLWTGMVFLSSFCGNTMRINL